MREPVKFGDYYLFDRIAVGGMAEVFKAVSYGVEGFERLFAIKRVLPSIAEDQEFIEMFIDEAKIAVQLTHANIGQIFELGNAEDSYYIAMEFVQGRDLRAIYDRARRRGEHLDIAMVCHAVKEVCEALEYAHGKRNERQEPLNLVHRDVSPQNIIVSYDGEVKLIDFGIAKAAGRASKTQAGILKGKFGYMSPEQVRGKAIDRRSDLFALAVVLYELLTLDRCFQGESDFSTLEKVRNVDIRRPASINTEIPPDLEEIVLKGLSKNPDERYQTAAEFQEALQKFLYGSGAFYGRKELGLFMRDTFSRELKREQDHLSAFRTYARENIREARRASSIPDVAIEPIVAAEAPFSPANPELSWDEEELETAVWDRSPSQMLAAIPLQAREPAFVRAPSPPPATPGQLPALPTPSARPVTLPMAHPPVQSTKGRLVALTTVTLLALVGAFFAVRHYTQLQPRELTVLSVPSHVTVHVDGALTFEGQTPSAAMQIAPGIHEVRISAPGHETLSRQVEIRPNENKELNVTLAVAKRPTGLEIETIPSGARVYLDDSLLEQTPLRTTGVEPGKRHLRIEKDGYLSWNGTVEATVGKIRKVATIKLFPASVAVTFLADPEGAEIALLLPDGKRLPLGPGPANYENLENKGQMRVLAKAPGYTPLERRLPQYYERRVTEYLNLKKIVTVATTKPTRPSRAARRTPRKPIRRPAPPKDPVATGCVGEDCPGSKTPRRPTKPVEPTPPPPAPIPVTVTPKPPAAQAATGFLKLLAKPPARAFVGGKDIGWTPLLRHRLPAGRQLVTLVREEDPAYRQTVSVQIEAGKTTFRKYIHQP